MARVKQTPQRHSSYPVIKKYVGKRVASPPNNPPINNNPINNNSINNDDKADIPLAPFGRVVNEITAAEVKARGTHRSSRRATAQKPQMRFQKNVKKALRTDAEALLTDIFADGQLLAEHRGAKTLKRKDIALVLQIRRR